MSITLNGTNFLQGKNLFMEGGNKYMEYQIGIKKTYKDRSDVDEYFFLNRAEDVILNKILEVDDYTVPQNGDALNDAINRYNEIVVALDQEAMTTEEAVTQLQESINTIVDTLKKYDKRLETLELHVEAAETELSNQGNYMGQLATQLADQNVAIAQQTTKINEIGLKAAVNEKSINDTNTEVNELKEIVNTLTGGEKVSFQEVTEDEIRGIFGKAIDPPTEENGE